MSLLVNLGIYENNKIIFFLRSDEITLLAAPFEIIENFKGSAEWIRDYSGVLHHFSNYRPSDP